MKGLEIMCNNHREQFYRKLIKRCLAASLAAVTLLSYMSAIGAEADEKFRQFTDRFLQGYWKLYPAHATYVGYYKHDDLLIVPDGQSRQQQRDFLQTSLRQLQEFERKSLSEQYATDLGLIQGQLESRLWYLDEFKEYQWNPSHYNVAQIFGLIINTDYKPLDERLKVISTRLDRVPAYYQAAQKSITEPTLPHTELAIQQNEGALPLFESTIPAALERSTLSDLERTNISKKLAAASNSIRDYIAWLQQRKTELEEGEPRDFRIGAKLYAQKFKHDIVSDYLPEELYKLALQAKQDLHNEMIGITGELWPKYFPDTEQPAEPLVAVKQMIDYMSARHVERDKFVDEIRRQIPLIQAFMDEKQLLDSDPTRPLVVRETPLYQRGFAGASVDAPGPYDATANTYYNVTPLDDYTDEQAESYLREYNHWILQILNIHEAIPGHYTQLMHANKSPSIIKTVFGNGAMIEGWAVYSERMMLEEGYGNDEPEMWLMYSKWNLRVVVNTILDYSVQVLGMSKDEALGLLMNEAFQERTEAEGKWRRATLSQVQLTSYFNGYSEIYAFREELKKKLGKKFDLRTFHNKFLSYGNAPVPMIRRLMLEELALN